MTQQDQLQTQFNNDFDIAGLIGKIAAYANALDLDQSNLFNPKVKAFDDMRREVLHIVMDDFPAFIAANWPKDEAAHAALFRQAKIQLAKNILDRPSQVLRHDQSGFSDRHDGREPAQVRLKSVYPISEDAVKTALDYEDAHPDWRMAIALLQVYTTDFLDQATLALQQADPNLISGSIRKSLVWGIMQGHKAEASKTSFLREFAPVMSSFMARNAANAEHESGFARALCETFRQEAFRSAQGGEVKTCPFGPVIGRLSSIVMYENPQGQLSVSERRKPGAFFMFLHDKASAYRTRRIVNNNPACDWE